jgi:pimeloyl-ACP methyl ester carboxylesterase
MPLANSGERMIRANGVDLCVQTFGRRGDPAILLIGGMSASMDWWEEEFCERLAAGSRWVIRYDHRDTGRSVTYEPGDPRYTGRDLQNDAVGVLDALRLPRAHLVGISMGGAMAQLIVLDHPDRVASLILVSTSAGPGDPDLPPASEEVRAAWREPRPEPDWSDRAAVIDYIIEGERVYAARSRPFDERAVRRIAERVVDRAVNLESSMKNHSLIDGGEPWRARLGEVEVPTLVMHGTEDPLFPFGHGEALAREIPGAQLLPMEQTGHGLPRAAWNHLVPAILRHTAGEAA